MNTTIAQETQKAIKETKERLGKQDSDNEAIVVHNQKADIYGINYSELISPIIKAIQELSSSSGANEREIAELKKQNAEFKARIDSLEKAIQH